MPSKLKTLATLGEISHLSLYFAEFIAAKDNQPIDSLLAFSAALVSEAIQNGDVCIMLEHYQSQPYFHSDSLKLDETPIAPDLGDWQNALLSSYCIGEPGQLAPLILEGSRLYLYRYWFYENELTAYIRNRLESTPALDQKTLIKTLKNLYSGQPVNQQQVAVALALRHRFTVISGGPGTGKTTTVINILAALLSQQSDLRVKLTAPTGKAAARMMESIRQGLDSDRFDEELRTGIPGQASTIHRLLGYRADGFRYTRHHKLALDCVVVDEASMVDLTMMYRLFDALPSHARVILLGDRDQLASVSAGNVLGDITGLGSAIRYSTSQIEWLNSVFTSANMNRLPIEVDRPISDSIALLTESYRFDTQSGIGNLAQLVNSGDSKSAINFLDNPGNPVKWYHGAGEALDKALLDEILYHYEAVVKADNVHQAFTAFESYRVLSAIHSGPFGVVEINRRIDESLRARGWIEPQTDFHGKPLLIQSNNYELDLFNGDIGLLWRGTDNRLYGYFRDIDQNLRRIVLTSLPNFEPAWAMTIHKSQGSEFDGVLLVMPEQNQRRPLSRELLYTGISRARKELAVCASVRSIEQACANPGQRHSGLASKLGW